jgi:hypothetical protein
MVSALFKEVPPQSISYIWTVTGCQHTLQPVPGDDFAAPSIPALTLRGFVQWESVEILLGPEEHVPFLQFAVKNWNLKNPDTGEVFPAGLPKEAFPTEPDADVDKWHKECAERLRELATPKEESKTAEARVRDGYSHVRARYHPSSPQQRPQTDYFSPAVAYAHVPAGRRGSGRSAAARSPERDRRRGSSSDERHARRKSFSDYPSPPHEVQPPFYSTTHLAPPQGQPRRHSQPRHHSSSSESDEMRMRRPVRPPRINDAATNAARRALAPQYPVVPGPVPVVPIPNAEPPVTPLVPRTSARSDESRRRSYPTPFESVKEKLSSYLPSVLTSDSRRSRSRSRGKDDSNGQGFATNGRNPRYSRDYPPDGRLRDSRSIPDLHKEDSDSEAERERRRRRKERQARERDQGAGRDYPRDRDGDRDQDRRDRGRDFDRRKRERKSDDDVSPKNTGQSSRERYPQRPPPAQRRTSSHADIDRRRDHDYNWGNRDRIRARDLDGMRFRNERNEQQRQPQNRNPSPAISGVGGRRYPSEAPWNN